MRRLARGSLYEVGRATLDSYISTRRINPYSLASPTPQSNERSGGGKCQLRLWLS
jgi:hypothetical protein